MNMKYEIWAMFTLEIWAMFTNTAEKRLRMRGAQKRWRGI
jgi:hypothetical protein